MEMRRVRFSGKLGRHFKYFPGVLPFRFGSKWREEEIKTIKKQKKIFSLFKWFLITSSEKSFPRRASIKGKGETLSLFKELVNGREGCQWGQNNLRPKSSFITTTFIRHHLSNRSGVVIDCWICVGPEFLCKIKISSS